MTPEEVRDLRLRNRIASGDRYAAPGVERIVTRNEGVLMEECRQIAGILQAVPDFAAQCDFGWAADPASYDVHSEASLQRRVLVMLAKRWAEARDRTGLADRISGIVVGQEFITRYGLASPRIRQMGPGRRLLTIPAGFFEQSLWMLAGLRCWAAARINPATVLNSDGGWSIVTALAERRPPQPFHHVTSYELIARTLAERGRDQALFGANAALLIREQVPPLAGRTGELDPNHLPHFDQNAAYLVAEFALAHELGHAIAGHALDGTAPPSDLAHEAEADRHACLLMALTAATRVFGWDQGGVLRPDVQAALGLALFDCLLAGRIALANGLLRRPSLGSSSNALMETECLRAAAARQFLSQLLVSLPRQGEIDDAKRIAALVDNHGGFLADLHQSILTLSDEDITFALELARRSVDMRG